MSNSKVTTFPTWKRKGSRIWFASRMADWISADYEVDKGI